MNSRQILLNKFRDNSSQMIDAADLRIFVNAVYDEMLLLEKVLDRADIFETDKVATINQVSIIKDTLNQLIAEVNTANSKYYTKDHVYTKTQIDIMFANLPTP